MAINNVAQGAEVTHSAFAVFKRLLHLAFQMQDPLLDEIYAYWRRSEIRVASDLPDVLRSAEILLEQNQEPLARRLLTVQSSVWLQHALHEAMSLGEAAEKRLRNQAALNLGPWPMKPTQLW